MKHAFPTVFHTLFVSHSLGQININYFTHFNIHGLNTYCQLRAKKALLLCCMTNSNDTRGVNALLALSRQTKGKC